MSENLGSFSDISGQKRGRFVGVASDRVMKDYRDFKSSIVNFTAFCAVHGTGHNVNLGHDPSGKNTAAGILLAYDVPYPSLMSSGGDMIYNADYPRLADWLNPKINIKLRPYFMEKFRGNSPHDNYDYNVDHNITRPIEE